MRPRYTFQARVMRVLKLGNFSAGVKVRTARTARTARYFKGHHSLQPRSPSLQPPASPHTRPAAPCTRLATPRTRPATPCTPAAPRTAQVFTVAIMKSTPQLVAIFFFMMIAMVVFSSMMRAEIAPR